MPRLKKLISGLGKATTSHSSRYRAEGDNHRDGRRWADAASSYRKHLDASPDDVAIWIQLGHALKEQGLLAEAESAYASAVSLDPNDADAQLQLGHILKQLSNPKRAAAAFRECMRLAPSQSVYHELSSLGFEAEAAALLGEIKPNTGESARYFELRDLFEYLLLHSTVTGISRVVIGLVSYIMEEMQDEESRRYHFVHQLGAGDALWLISRQKLRQLIRNATAEVVDHQAVIDVINSIKAEAPFVQLRSGDLYFIPGAFWDAAASPTFLPGLKNRGVRVGAYIYDLIPITHPHYCTSGLTKGFNIAFAESATSFDFALTISKFVADEVSRFLAMRGLRRFPTIAVPLAHELEFGKHSATQRRLPNPAIEHLLDRDFVLCVCTIEARKNHIYLFYIWQDMINEGLDVPDLVFVGRYGWRVTDLIGQIDASDHLDGHLHIMHGLSDADLSTLYDTCLFTVFPSFVEGWGLPVGESLSHGKVCVASSTSSIPEVGGKLATYIDPFNMHSGTEVIRKLIADPRYRQELEARIQREFVPRTWKAVGKDFFAGLDDALVALPDPETIRTRTWPKLAPGTWLDVWTLQMVLLQRRDYVKNPLRLIFSEGWRNVEESGTWMRGQRAALQFQSGEQAGASVFILLSLSSSRWAGKHNSLRIWIGDPDQKPSSTSDYRSEPIPPDRKYWARLKGVTGADGVITINFKIDGKIEVEEPNIPVLVRLHGLGFAGEKDYAARLDLLEQALLPV